MKPINVAAFLLLICVIGIISWDIVSDRRAGYFITISPERRTVEKRITVPGHVYPCREVEIKSHLSGVLDSLYVRVGDDLKPGDPIASVKLVPNSSNMEQLQTNLNIASIEFKASEMSYSRNLELYEQNIISKQEMEESEKSYTIFREKYNSAKSQLEIMRQGYALSSELSNMVTSSTFGTIIDIPIETGMSVIERNNYNAGTTIAVLAQMDRFIFRAKVPERNLAAVCPGSCASLTFSAYDSLCVDARVVKVAAKGEDMGQSVNFMIEAEFDMTPEMPLIRSGYSATATFIADVSENALTIPEKHIRFSNDSVFVFVLDSISEKPVKRLIKTAVSDGEVIEITEGVAEFDKIIVNYNDKND